MAKASMDPVSYITYMVFNDGVPLSLLVSLSFHPFGGCKNATKFMVATMESRKEWADRSFS